MDQPISIPYTSNFLYRSEYANQSIAPYHKMKYTAHIGVMIRQSRIETLRGDGTPRNARTRSSSGISEREVQVYASTTPQYNGARSLVLHA